MLEEASRTLAGLSAVGLRPHDKIILQLENLKDHFAAFWACILGGIAPVTIAVPPIYQENNSLVQKLIGAWEILEHPTLPEAGTGARRQVYFVTSQELSQ